MPPSKHYYSAAAEPDAAEDKGDDTLLALSLGDIYSNNAAPAARATADAGGVRSPVVSPIVPAPVRPADVLVAPSAAAAAVHAPPRFDALVVEGSGAFPAVSFPTISQMAMMVFPRDGNGVVPAPAVHGEVTPPAPTKRPTKRLRSARGRSSTAAGHPGAGGSNAHATDTSSRHGPLQANNGGGDARCKEGGLPLCPPYPWSTGRVGLHHSLAELSKRGIDTITGELQCKRCDDLKLVSLDVEARFRDLCGYISCNIHSMDDRAPQRWKEPALPDCDKCGQKSSMRPVIPAEKHKINWVFLLLSEMLGLCTLEQLKHFCEHTQQHRTGAKDRVLYSTYMELCNQLLPNGIFDMASERQKRTRPNA